MPGWLGLRSPKQLIVIGSWALDCGLKETVVVAGKGLLTIVSWFMGGPAGEPLRRMAGDFGQMISVPWPHLLLVKGTNQQSGPFRHLTEAAEELGSRSQ